MKPSARPPRPLHDNNALWDEPEDEVPPGDPHDLRDEGILESLGKAISSPVRDSQPEPPATPDTKARPADAR